MNIFELTHFLFGFNVKDFNRFIIRARNNMSIIRSHNYHENLLYSMLRMGINLLLLTVVGILEMVNELFGLKIKDFYGLILGA